MQRAERYNVAWIIIPIFAILFFATQLAKENEHPSYAVAQAKSAPTEDEVFDKMLRDIKYGYDSIVPGAEYVLGTGDWWLSDAGKSVTFQFDFRVVNAYGAKARHRATTVLTRDLSKAIRSDDEFLYFEK